MKSIDVPKHNPQKILILHDIRSAQNVGSIFRTADAGGIDMVYLSKITPAPVDRFGRTNTSVTKASLGAEQTVVWKQYDDIDALLEELKNRCVQLIAIEQSQGSNDYKKVVVKLPVAFILGNEVDGLSQKIIERVDVVAEIPMAGIKESLNVAVATGIALFRILNI